MAYERVMKLRRIVARRIFGVPRFKNDVSLHFLQYLNTYIRYVKELQKI